MKESSETGNKKEYDDSEISNSILSAIDGAEQVINLLIERSQEKAQEEAEQAFKEYQTRIKQIASEIVDNVSAGSVRISENISRAIKRKVEKEAFGISSNFVADSIKKAEEAVVDPLQTKNISKIDYELAKAAAELKDKTSKLNKAADSKPDYEPDNNGKGPSNESKKDKKDNRQEEPPENNEDKVEDIIRFFS